MLLRRVVLIVLAVVVALPFAQGVARAEPDGAVRAQAERHEDSVEFTVSNGSVAVEDGYLVVKNRAGKTVDKYNLTFVAPDKSEYDVAAIVKGKTATLTPSRVARTQVAKKRKPGQIVCGPATKAQRDHEALETLNSELATSVTIGALVGAIIGAVIGIVGIVTIPIGGAIGGLIGAGIGLGGAAANGAFARYFATVNSKFTPKWC
ncbi:hypothetical protein MUG78_02720 [Gordonia alkaliphila]|uniref:hypothetical protein n=1 Tax=Gordonia alkaliphila TaxID=1053547 RepID=UPI001FF17B99|nr:hypothetical protein [Gordonia alkaliphila]MCK0438401.1 hypothetical protein [Gordonia alkaliphila]